MQQLNNWLEQEGKLVFKDPDDKVEQAADMLMVRLSGNEHVQIMDTSYGADRLQVVFRYANIDFVLQCETLCEAMWIEALGSHLSDDQTIKQLKKLLELTS